MYSASSTKVVPTSSKEVSLLDLQFLTEPLEKQSYPFDLTPFSRRKISMAKAEFETATYGVPVQRSNHWDIACNDIIGKYRLLQRK